MTPKTDSTVTTITRKIGLNRGKARLWIEGVALASQGWVKGTPYIVGWQPGEVTYRATADLTHPVPNPVRKVAGTKDRPIIDTNTDRLVDMLGVMPGSEVHITLTPMLITIREFVPALHAKAEAMKPHHQPVAAPLKAGDRVLIYEDPLTRQKPEGVAQLVSNNHKPDLGKSELQGWQVRFFGETNTVARWVLPTSPVLP